jgi:predicted MFS family arabinose efflux permease
MTRHALLLGNFVTGITVLAPAGMLIELSQDLRVSIEQAGWLVTFGAVVLCFGSPLMAWATSRMDRRTLLAGTLAVIALGQAASAIAPGYFTLLVARLLMLAVAAVYTPQAAGTIGLIVSEKERPGAIAYIFIGWTLAVAAGLPLVTFMTASFGWRSAFAALAVIAMVAAAFNALGLPKNVHSPPVALKSWLAIARNRFIVLLLLVTVLIIAGGFQVFTFLGPLLSASADAGPTMIGVTFAAVGLLNLLGSIVTTGAVGRLGPYRTSFVLLAAMLVGLVVWSAGFGTLPLMLSGLALLAIGAAGSNSMQQARLAAAAPELAGASIALNTSSIYVGQAIGSAIGGALLVHDLGIAIGYVAAVLMAAALLVLWQTREVK